MPSLSAKKVLIVEDHPMLSDILERHLGDLGLKVAIARTGEGALNKSAELVPNLILLDLGLPDMNGLEVVSVIRNNPLTSRIPIIAVSGSKYLKAQALARGCNDFLAKPFFLLDAVIRIKTFLNRNKNVYL